MEATRDNWERDLLDEKVLPIVARHDQDAAEWFEKARWPDGPSCLRCGSDSPYLMKARDGERTRREWRCKECRYIFTVRRGTWMDSTKIPLTAWCWALAVAMKQEDQKKAAIELADRTGIQTRTAQRIVGIAAGVVQRIRNEPEPVPIGADGAASGNDQGRPVARRDVPELVVVPLDEKDASQALVGVELEPRAEPSGQRAPLWQVIKRPAVAMLLAAVAVVAALFGSSLNEQTVLVDQWVSKSGDEFQIHTGRFKDESESSWRARHQKSLEVMLAMHPPAD